ncbi:MAG: MFS transporter [Bryobacterales bacterium]|nr:MFS transporter [Bryobacteraceae bacterium]MDW8130864.1 MFS transporter [Bryobacterales bacterium]
MEAQQPAAESARRWWLAALLVAAMILAYAQRGAISVAAPFLMKDTGLTPAGMGLLLSAFFWAYSFLQVPAGWLVDRLGVRRAYAAGFAFWSLASAATAYATNLLSLIVVRVMLGVGQAVAFPASARAVANWFQPRERGSVTAAYLTGVRLGQALVSAVGGLFLASRGWKAFFLWTGLLPMIWLLPWWRLLGRVESRAAGEPTGPPAPRLSLVRSIGLLRQRTVLGIFLGFFAYDYVWFLFVTWLPGYLVVERGFGPKEMGFYSSVPYLGMSVVIVLAGLAGDWLIRRGLPETAVRKTFIVAGLGIACLVAPAGLVEDKMLAVWLLTLSICALGLASPNTWTLTQAMCERSIVGTVSGIQNFGGNVGGILAPAVTGYIAQATGSFALALGLAALISLLGIAAYLGLISRRVEAVRAAPAIRRPAAR